MKNQKELVKITNLTELFFKFLNGNSIQKEKYKITILVFKLNLLTIQYAVQRSRFSFLF